MMSPRSRRCVDNNRVVMLRKVAEQMIDCGTVVPAVRGQSQTTSLCHKHRRCLLSCLVLLCVLVLMLSCGDTIVGAVEGEGNAPLPDYIGATALRCRLEQLEIRGNGTTDFSVTIYNSWLHPLYLDLLFFKRLAVGSLLLYPVDSSCRLQLRWCSTGDTSIRASELRNREKVQIGPGASVTLTASWSASSPGWWRWKRLESTLSIRDEDDVMRGEVVKDLSGLHVAAQLSLLARVSTSEDSGQDELLYVPCDSVKWLCIGETPVAPERAHNADHSRTAPERRQDVDPPLTRSESGVNKEKRDH
jgi:hypothetical protein